MLLIRFLFSLLLFLPTSEKNLNPNTVMGKWKSENGKQIIEVYYQPNAKKYFGKVYWMAEDDPSKGTLLLDIKNPNTELRKRRITGIDMLHHFEYIGDREYLGKIYDPVSGNDYKCKIVLSEDGNTAYVRGYIFVPLLGRTEITHRIN